MALEINTSLTPATLRAGPRNSPLADLLAQCDQNATVQLVLSAWEAMTPVGREVVAVGTNNQPSRQLKVMSPSWE